MSIKVYFALLKPRIGIMIALTAMVGYLAVAVKVNALQMVLLAIAMMLGAASSAVFNHYYDRDIDRIMSRTSGRPLARDLLAKPQNALWFSGFLLVSGLALASFAFNTIVALHLLLGAFFYTVVYTVWLKRRTWLNIVIGGAAGSFAVLAGAAASDPGAWLLPWLLAIFLFLWTPSHFWSLAIVLKEDYAAAGVPMLPVLVGDEKTAKAIMINSVLLVTSSLVPWFMGQLGHLYGLVTLTVGIVFLWASFRLWQEPSRLWARRVFLGSIPYLLIIFLAIVLDVHLK